MHQMIGSSLWRVKNPCLSQGSGLQPLRAASPCKISRIENRAPTRALTIGFFLSFPFLFFVCSLPLPSFRHAFSGETYSGTCQRLAQHLQ